MSRHTPLLLGSALLTLAPLTAQAQGLSGKIGELIRFGTCSQSLCLVTGPGEHQGHYLESARTASEGLASYLTGSITSAVGRLPVSATSSGTTFRIINGAPVQISGSNGPIFAERAPTLGYKRVLFGVNTSTVRFSKLRGQNTSDLQVNLGHQDVGTSGLGDPGFETDVVGIGLDLALNLQVTSLFATYGVSDRLDVSLAIPVVNASLDGTGLGRVYNATGGAVSGVHIFGTATSPSLTANSAVTGSAAGIGDIAARAKFNLKQDAKKGLALLADVRLPTGDEANFLGSGSLAANALLIGSASYGNFTPHANVGYALRTGDGQHNALLATVGFDHQVNKAVTVAVDVISEVQAGGDSGTLPPDLRFNASAGSRTVAGTNIPRVKDNPVGLSAGGRFLVKGYVATINGLVPIKTGGLQSSFISTFGIERKF